MKLTDLEKINDHLWEIPKSHRPDMHVPARVYATETMLQSIVQDRSLEQLVNVCTIPGIRKYALAMPDVHEGYGFPIGGVAAVGASDGAISPGGIGYDINCGVRLLRSSLTLDEIRPRLEKLAHSIAREIPSGVGRGGSVRLKGQDLDLILRDGARRAVEMGHGREDDLKHIESGGRLDGADPHVVSQVARERGFDQLGTIGSGNHFVEIDRVEQIFDEEEAARLGLVRDGIVVQIHTGSRGLGHQVATDSIKGMMKAMPAYGITVADRELACAPISSREGQRYMGGMASAANFAFANRQLITAGIRRAWSREFGDDVVEIVYDVAHNVAKVERYPDVGEVVVHRKGATRAFPGQPVLIPGSMGTASYVLVGLDGAMEQTFGSSCHGAGRTMSRTKARTQINAEELRGRLRKLGIIAEAGSSKGLVEEAPEAYKDIDAVVDVVARAGIAKKVARVVPIAVVKG
ncbi:MAG TPA: RtcB family protein [Thermoanaerobaculia bacterium]|nr:RtcB family protein [Thermoanaerobaculia bacterium]